MRLCPSYIQYTVRLLSRREAGPTGPTGPTRPTARIDHQRERAREREWSPAKTDRLDRLHRPHGPTARTVRTYWTDRLDRLHRPLGPTNCWSGYWGWTLDMELAEARDLALNFALQV
jgi:hypothetical protein